MSCTIKGILLKFRFYRNLQELMELEGSPLQLPPKGRDPTKVGLEVKADRQENEDYSLV